MDPKQIAIVGAGPIGLEAALYARTLGHDVVVFESGQTADNVRAWQFVQLFSPWSMNATPLGWKTLAKQGLTNPPHGQICPSGTEFLERYLAPLAGSPLLRDRILTQTTVLSIGRDDIGRYEEIEPEARAKSPFRILVRNAAGFERIEKADIVVDCSGTYKHHRWAGRGGIPAPGERALEHRICYHLPDILGRDQARFIDRHTLLLGAGFSAATVLTTLEQLNRDHPRTKVSWAIRRVGQAMQALHNDTLEARANLVKASLRLADHPPHWLQYLGNCVLERIEGEGPFSVTLKYANTDLALTVDEIVAVVGYSPDTSIYEQLQMNQPPTDTLRNPEPNFYVLGAKSFGTNSNFLLQIGHTQIRDLFRLIQNDPQVDLYRA